MALDAIGLALSATSLGLKLVTGSESTSRQIQYGLSFVLPEKAVMKIFDDILLDDVDTKLQEVKEKVDLLLSSEQKTSVDTLQDALRGLRFNDDPLKAAALFDKARSQATRAFHHGQSMDDWLACTKLKLTATYFSKSLVSKHGLVPFGHLEPLKQREIAETFLSDVEKLLDKADQAKQSSLEAMNSKKLRRKSKLISRTKNDVKAVDLSLDRVLTHTYPLISQGLKWTNPFERGDEAKVEFKVHPRFLPSGHDGAVAKLLLSNDLKLVATLHRSSVFMDPYSIDVKRHLIAVVNGDFWRTEKLPSSLVGSSSYDQDREIEFTLQGKELSKALKKGQKVDSDLKDLRAILGSHAYNEVQFDPNKAQSIRKYVRQHSRDKVRFT